MTSSPKEPDYDTIVVARVVGVHGRDGGLNIKLLSDLPGRFDPGNELLVDQRPHLISASRQTGPDSATVWLEGVASRSQATHFAGKYLSASPADESSLDEGEYFHYQLIGMRVRTDEGEDLGELQEILETGSNDVYIVRDAGVELLIPATVQVVIEVDVVGRAMTVHLPDGLR